MKDVVTHNALATHTTRIQAWALLGLGDLLCFWFALDAGARLMQSVRAQTWRPTTGTVTASGTHFEGGSDGQGGVYFLDLTYRYHVNGVAYTGTRFNLSQNSLGPRDDPARETAERFPVGARVLVHFDQARPDDSVLDNALYWNHWALAVLASVLAAAGVWFVWRASTIPALGYIVSREAL